MDLDFEDWEEGLKAYLLDKPIITHPKMKSQKNFNSLQMWHDAWRYHFKNTAIKLMANAVRNSTSDET